MRAWYGKHRLGQRKRATGAMRDLHSKAKLIQSVAKWRRNPGRYDLAGVDTPAAGSRYYKTRKLKYLSKHPKSKYSKKTKK